MNIYNEIRGWSRRFFYLGGKGGDQMLGGGGPLHATISLLVLCKFYYDHGYWFIGGMCDFHYNKFMFSNPFKDYKNIAILLNLYAFTAFALFLKSNYHSDVSVFKSY